MNFDRNKVEMVKRQYPVGTRIQLHSLCNDEQGRLWEPMISLLCS